MIIIDDSKNSKAVLKGGFMFRVLVLGIDLNASYFHRSYGSLRRFRAAGKPLSLHFSRQPQSINQVVCGSNTQGEQIESWIGVSRIPIASSGSF
jgi:hypothetical protein